MEMEIIFTILPWLLVGDAVAVFAVAIYLKKKNRKYGRVEKDYMIWGMCLGLTIGTAGGYVSGNMGIGAIIGMLLGMVVGINIIKENTEIERN